MAGQTGGDTRAGAPPGRHTAPASDRAPSEPDRPDGAAESAAGQPADDELLCTICGLTACWKAPAKPPTPAAPAGSTGTPAG